METLVNTPVKKEPYKKLIIALSVILPLAVASLFKVKIEGYDFFIPSPDLCHAKWLYCSISSSSGNRHQKWQAKTS